MSDDSRPIDRGRDYPLLYAHRAASASCIWLWRFTARRIWFAFVTAVFFDGNLRRVSGYLLNHADSSFARVEARSTAARRALSARDIAVTNADRRRLTRTPTASHSRRTSRLRPSVSVTLYRTVNAFAAAEFNGLKCPPDHLPTVRHGLNHAVSIHPPDRTRAYSRSTSRLQDCIRAVRQFTVGGKQRNPQVLTSRRPTAIHTARRAVSMAIKNDLAALQKGHCGYTVHLLVCNRPERGKFVPPTLSPKSGTSIRIFKPG